jgi:cytoskeletal protein CcmA (bactofilin family)
MAITQITSQVIADRGISSDQLADNSVDSRHYVDGSIDSEHLSVSVVTGGPIAANINLVQSNVVSTQTNVNITSTNVAAVIANATANFTRANANIDLVQSNVTAILDTTTDLNIDGGTFFIDKSIDAIGIGNTAPSRATSMTFGTPANVFIDYGDFGGNLIVGGGTATSFRLDVKGTANTGDLTAISGTFGGGYGSTGTTISSAGVIQTDGAITTDSSLTAASVTSDGVELRANDYATYLVALGGLTGTNAKLQANTLAFLGAHAGANTNITNLVTGLQGANTNISSNDTDITNLVTGLQGANTNISSNDTDITNLVTGLQGANTNISSNDTDITNLVTGLTGSNSAIAAITDGSTAFTGAVTMNDDLTIQGNLTVAGSFANLAVQDSYTDDRLLFLANNFTGSPSLDVGLLLNRGNDGNVFIGYDESQGEVALLHNFDPATNTAISGSAAANLRLNTGYFDDGTAGAPSITFDNDPNTGIYRSAAETITFTTSGTARFSITTTSMGSPTTGGIRLLSANGTAAAPAFNFSGDTDTGMYRTGTDGLGFSTGGTAALTIADNQDASFASNVNIADGQYIRVGDSQDLQIYHDGTNSYVKEQGIGELRLGSDGAVRITKHDTETMALFTVDGAVDLYYDNSVKLTTKTDGVDITGELQSDSLDVDGNGDISGTLTLGSHLIMGDSDEIQLGASTDLKIYHDGTDSTVYNFTGDLHIRNTATDKDVAIASDDGSGGLANYFLADGSTTAALLYFGGSTKLTTTSTGIDVTGSATTDGLTVDGNITLNGLLAIAATGTGDTISIDRTDNTKNGMIKHLTGSTADWIVGQRNTTDSDYHIYSYGTSTDVLTIARATGAATFTNSIISDAATPQIIWKVSGTEKGYARVSSGTLQINATDDMALRVGGSDKVTIDSSGNTTFSNLVEIDGSLRVQGTIPSQAASTLAMDHFGGAARIVSYGADATTVGSFQFIQQESDGGGSVTWLSTDTSGNPTFTGALTAASVTSNGVELRANDYITYTQLNANLNAVSSNADSKVTKAGDTMSGDLNMGSNYVTNLSDPVNPQDAATRAYALSLLGTSIVPTYVTNTSVGTSNVIALTNSPFSIDRISVALNGVVQAPTADWIFNSGNNSIQYTVASLPSGLVSVISSWDTP